MINFKGKNVLITGGSRGIGKACVKLFYKAGAKVAFTYFNDSDAARKVEVENGASPKAYQCDISINKSIVKMSEQVISDFGRIDILVNNAGIWTYGEIGSMDKKVWDDIIGLNLTGAFFITQQFVNKMKENKFGKIIFVTSTAAQRGEAFHSHYAATKGALNAITKSLAVELADFNITVNAAAPGWVDTEMNDGIFAESGYREKIEEGIPLGRIATTEDVAGPILFLASDLARHITGEVLNINGGSVLAG